MSAYPDSYSVSGAAVDECFALFSVFHDGGGDFFDVFIGEIFVGYVVVV